MKTKRFKIGQKVYYIDDTYGRIEGKVVDKTTTSIFIKWEDMKNVIEHPLSWCSDIKISHKK